MPTPKLASTSFSLDLLTDPPVNICKPDLASPCGLESFRSLLQHHNTIQLHSENNSSLPPAHPQVIKPATKQNPFPPLGRTHPKNHPISLPLLSSHLITTPLLSSHPLPSFRASSSSSHCRRRRRRFIRHWHIREIILFNGIKRKRICRSGPSTQCFSPKKKKTLVYHHIHIPIVIEVRHSPVTMFLIR